MINKKILYKNLYNISNINFVLEMNELKDNVSSTKYEIIIYEKEMPDNILTASIYKDYQKAIKEYNKEKDILSDADNINNRNIYEEIQNECKKVFDN